MPLPIQHQSVHNSVRCIAHLCQTSIMTGEANLSPGLVCGLSGHAGELRIYTQHLKLTLWSGCDSNARPPVYQTGAAKPSELPDHYVCRPGGIRTHSVSMYWFLRPARFANFTTDPFWCSILIRRLQSTTHASILQKLCQTL